MFVVNKTTNDVIGYTITDTDSSHDATNGYYAMDSPAQLLWRVHVPNDQQIIDVNSHHNIGNDILLYQLIVVVVQIDMG